MQLRKNYPGIQNPVLQAKLVTRRKVYVPEQVTPFLLVMLYQESATRRLNARAMFQSVSQVRPVKRKRDNASRLPKHQQVLRTWDGATRKQNVNATNYLKPQ